MKPTIHRPGTPTRVIAFPAPEVGTAQPGEAAAARPAGDATQRLSLLIADDESAVREVLHRAFAGWGYDVTAVPSGDAALALLRERSFALMFCDHRMPGMTGAQTVRAALAIDPDLAIVMLTAINDARLATEVLGMGALGFVTKPFDLDELRAAAEGALKKRSLRSEQRRVELLIRDEVAHRTEALEREKAALRALTVGIAETLINAMEAKDVYLRGHSQRVADLSASIAGHLGMDDDLVEQVRLAGRLHDVGKIGIQESVLNKPGKLTPEEFLHVKEHVRIGVEILAPLGHLGRVIEFVHDHHEHWDGGGYPRGRRGDAISPGGRVLAVADTFDALTSRRAYRDAVDLGKTLEYMSSLRGTQLDPDALAALMEVVQERRALPFLDEHVG